MSAPQPQWTPPPAGAQFLSFDEVYAATACDDCINELRFIPAPAAGGRTVLYTAVLHDTNCPAFNAAMKKLGEQ